MGEGTGGLRDVIPLTASQQELGEKREPQSESSSGISLDDLRRAFESAMHLPKPEGDGYGGAGYGDPADDPESRAGSRSETQAHPEEGPAVPLTPAAILEAILFVASPNQASLSMTALEDILQGMSAKDIENTIDELNESYRRCGHPWQIVCEGDVCSLQLLQSIELSLDRLQSPPRDTALSQNSIDCLSLIAYRPGITKGELESLWGQSAGATLSYLAKKGLVRIEEGSDGGLQRYFTTERFLGILGLQSLEDLPQGEEL